MYIFPILGILAAVGIFLAARAILKRAEDDKPD